MTTTPETRPAPPPPSRLVIAGTDQAIIDLAHKLRAAERYYRAVLAALDGPAENTEGFDHRDELRAYDAKLAAEAALYDAIDKAGAS